MLQLKKIAITGGIAAGKSTFSALLKERGAFVLDTDEIVHSFLSSDSETIDQVKSVFGDKILKDGKIDRKKLGKIVFSDADKLQKLEAIVHPKVKEFVQKTYADCQKSQIRGPFVCEVSLLFETGFENFFDEIIYVQTNQECRKTRFMNKGFSEQDFALREQRFLPEKEKISLSHVIIQGDNSLNLLQKKASQLI